MFEQTEIQSGVGNSESGFTLFEIIVAVAIAAVVLTILYGIFSVTLANIQETDLRQELYHKATYVMNHMTQTLQSAYLTYRGASLPLSFVGTDNSFEEGDGDSLEFFSSEPEVGRRELPSDLKLVSYSVEEAYASDFEGPKRKSSLDLRSDDRVVLALKCQETQLLVYSESSGDNLSGESVLSYGLGGEGEGEGESIGENESGLMPNYVMDLRDLQKKLETKWVFEIGGLNFQYFDGEEWLGEWDSSSNGGLPRAVRIELQFYDRPKDDKGYTSVRSELVPYVFSTIVTMPLGMGVDEYPVTRAEGEAATSGQESQGESLVDSRGRVSRDSGLGSRDKVPETGSRRGHGEDNEGEGE